MTDHQNGRIEQLIQHFEKHETTLENFRKKVEELNGTIPRLRKDLKRIEIEVLPSLQKTALIIETRTSNYNQLVEKAYDNSKATRENSTHIENIWHKLNELSSGQSRIFYSIIIIVLLTAVKFIFSP